MKRLLVVLLVIIGVTFILLLGSGLVAKAFLSGSSKDSVVSSLSKTMGAPLSVDRIDFDLGQWFRFKPALAMEGVTIGNPPGFTSKHLLEAKEMTAQVDLFSLFGKTVQVHSITIQRPRILVEENRQGITNIEALLKGASAESRSPGKAAAESRGVRIDSFTVDSGEIVVAGGDTLNLHDIQFRVLNFSADRTADVELNAKLFRGNRSDLGIRGQAGPFGADSLPMRGTLAVTLAPSEIPPAVRVRELGDLLADPGDSALVKLDASVRGDVYGRLSGPAKLELSKILVGRDKDHRMPLEGDASLTFTLIKPVSSRAYQIHLPSATFRLGKGEWKSRTEIQVQGPVTSGSTSGSIRNAAIEDMLSTFTTPKEKVYGLLEIPEYSLSFSGRDANQLRNSLSGNGRISISKGKVAALDLLASIQRAIQSPGQNPTDTKGATEFTTLSANFDIRNQKVSLSQIALDSPATRVIGDGSIGFDQTLGFSLNARVTGRLAELLGKRAQGDQTAEALVPVMVNGTAVSPEVRPNIGKLATGTALNYLERLLKK